MIRRTRDTGLTSARTNAADTGGGRPQRPTRPGLGGGTTTPAGAGGRPTRPSRPTRESQAAAPATSRGRPSPAPQARPSGRAQAGDAPPTSTGIPGDTLVLMRELTALLNWENAELKARRYHAIQETLERKQALTRGYQEKFIAFYRDPKLAEELEPDRRTALKEQSKLLTAAMETNHNLLRAGMDAVKAVMGNVVDAMEQHKADQASHYEGSGRLEARHGDLSRLSISLNKEL